MKTEQCVRLGWAVSLLRVSSVRLHGISHPLRNTTVSGACSVYHRRTQQQHTHQRSHGIARQGYRGAVVEGLVRDSLPLSTS